LLSPTDLAVIRDTAVSADPSVDSLRSWKR
jgi:hypothetical protein